jgi:hypothetical protein
MLATPSQLRLPSPTAVGQIHQLYITHCLYDEGLFRQAGFAPRASSTRDPLLLRFAQEYPSFELPAGMTASEGALAESLRRLALVRLPGGQKALIHSVALPAERHGRANDFFSHILIAPTLTPRDTLPLWASPNWTTDCPTETGKDLPPLTALPAAGPINDRELTRFLRADLEGEQDLVCPPRLLDDAARRRELLSLTVRGCLLALRAGPGASGSRFFMLAEPELVALLLYGAIRLLPPHLVTDLTFSTCEPRRHALRANGLAQIVGLYPDPGGAEIDAALFKEQGWFLDTFAPRCSDELRMENEAAIAEWIDLAVMGEWKMLDKVYGLLGNTGPTIVSFQRGLQAARLARRLTTGKAETGDLLALKRSPWGPALMEQNRENLWALVRDASLSDPIIQEEFSDLLAEHLPELEQRVSEAFRAIPLGDWQRNLRVLRAALRGDSARLRETLQRLLPPPPYPADLRLGILRELHQMQVFPPTQPMPLQSLLRQCTVEELRQLAQSDLPRPWFVWTLCHAIVRPETQDEAVRLLQSSDDPLLQTFWEQFKLLKEESQRRPILAPLLKGKDGKAVLFFSRSLRVLPSLRLDTLEWVLETLGALSRDWNDFWCSEDHLARLLELLRNLGDDAEKLWNQLHANIDPETLLLGEASQRAFVLNLAAARDRPGLPLPAWASQTIDDWVLLREHFEKAGAVLDSERGPIIEACRRRGVDIIRVLRRYFERFVLPQPLSGALLADFVGFFDSFYLPGNDYQEAGARFLGWIDISRSCPDESRQRAYQQFYLDHGVVPEFRDRLAVELLGDVPPPSPPVTIAESPPVVAPPAPDRSVLVGDTFALTGIRPAASPLAAMASGSPWLLCSFAGGLLSVLVFGAIKVPPRQLALLCSFIPLVLAVAEGTVLQHLAVGRIPASRRDLLRSVLAGIGLALLGGAVAAGVAWLFNDPLAKPRYAVVFAVGEAVAAGMLGASLLGLLVPRLLRGLRMEERLPAGPIARAFAGIGALTVYLLIAAWLVR